MTFGLATSAILLASCSTPENRISEHPEMYQTLSPKDQALVTSGHIRTGMSKNAVFLAWGSPDQKTEGAMHGRATESWVYFATDSAGYGYGGYGYPYGGYGYGGYGPGFGYGQPGFGYGFAGGGVIRSHHGHGRFVVFGDPFYDPFFYSGFAPTVAYPYKVVTFSNGRVRSFQYLVPGGVPRG